MKRLEAPLDQQYHDATEATRKARQRIERAHTFVGRLIGNFQLELASRDREQITDEMDAIYVQPRKPAIPFADQE